ncbi:MULTISPECIES: thiolase family protein [unclassified Mycolicibacterium]|uniref:thiolase family protein n=1 Tax=unclassified Mycolicibacterium TaxID=2636767 RepID=UPI0012DC3461|nr:MULTISPECIES: thiolase family protein [unclassified Mycolicibacterium]MUL85795.1 thiolase family protein [Mycolicibacterium sp. CBMA 329]MUL90165.1 thiolase family protein [Mycolicibacterium sp. CBMA 331]MUM00934.1 thiolase family protein [Mycolicibacterium sp. CBMA 334]MUM27474.1 thiolase family protein [Mycolicibacterium sp. CBMA 295]MUM39680.1 thiolase family protein [Mycolicibacterium sp. CBMA 247]
MAEAFVLGGVRTPFARYGSSLSHIRADDLLGMTMKCACERVGVPLDQIEDIVAGCVNPAHEGMGDVGRWAALAAGFPDSVAGATINRFCASSLSATINVAHAIKAGDLGVGIACGVESMSRSGWAYMKGDAPFSPRGPVILLDTMWAGAGGPPNPALLARNAYIGMIETAQNVADRYGLTREEIDAFALRTQRNAKAARDSGRLAKEIMPIEIAATKKAPGRLFEHDEFIRDDTTAEQLAKLPPQPGTTQMTAANSTPLTDGASALVLASGERAAELGVEPLARVVSSAVYGIDPVVMGLAPAWALPLAIKRAGLTPEQIDVWEVHEAFSAQALGVLRELPNQLDGFTVPDDKLTPNGGAVAIGHPFGATGARYVLTLATELRERNARYGVIGVCVGSGQGVAVVLENPSAS